MSYTNVPISLYKNPFSPRTSSFKSPLLQPLTTALTLTPNFISLSSSPVFPGETTLLTFKHRLNHYPPTIFPSDLFSILFISNAFFLTHSSCPFIPFFWSLFPIGFFSRTLQWRNRLQSLRHYPNPKRRKNRAFLFTNSSLLQTNTTGFSWSLVVLVPLSTALPCRFSSSFSAKWLTDSAKTNPIFTKWQLKSLRYSQIQLNFFLSLFFLVFRSQIRLFFSL